MMKNVLLTVAVLSVALWTGCATGGSGHTGAKITVSVDSVPSKVPSVGVNLTVSFTATVEGTDNKAVMWSLTYKGAACAAALCGTLSSNGLYTAPAVAPAAKQPDNEVEITATSVANPTKSATFLLPVLGITVVVTPAPSTVGTGLHQQFVATVTPDAEPQTVQWSIPVADCPGNCGSIDPNTGLYTAPNTPPSGSFKIQAASTVDPNTWVTTSTVTVVHSRIPAGTYAFQFSGTNIVGPIASIGTVVSDGNGNITSGVQDEISTSGPLHRLINSGSYTFDSNNHGALTLKPAGVPTDTYVTVVDASGDVKVIETTSDGTNRHTSGVINLSSPTKFKDKTKLSGSFVFEFTGTDGNGQRVGYAGLLPMDGNGGIAGGLMDINGDGIGTNGTPSNVTGSYDINNGAGFLTLVAGGSTYHFNIYGVNGTTNANNPLTLYAISTDALVTNPAVAGTIVYQDRSVTFNNAGFSGTSVASLTGASGTDTVVSLSSLEGEGNGNVFVFYDENNAGTLSSIPFGTPASYTYAANPTGTGRYTVDLLGDPSKSIAPTHFILYCNALVKQGSTNSPRGFLLEQFDAADTAPTVMTGTLDPQVGSGGIAAAELPGPYAAATTASGSSGVLPVAANLVLTSPGNQQFVVSGTLDVTGQTVKPVTGTYSVNVTGNGAIKITPSGQDEQNYIIYVLDPAHFMMMNTDAGHASIISAQQ